MIEYTYTLDNTLTTTHFVETRDDLEAFKDWFDSTGPIVSADIESTSLKVFSRSFNIRLVQFGDELNGWVLPADQWKPAIARVLARADKRFAFHNGFGFDVPALAFHNFADLESLAPRIVDTRLIAHLIDPRPAYQGGQGLSLKQLADLLVDPSAPDTSEDLHRIFREMGYTKKSGLGWAHIPITHPTYVLYAGLDVILLARVLKELGYALGELREGQELARKEHELAHIVARMHIRGMHIDVPYTEKLVYTLETEERDNAERALMYGVANVNSVVQVRKALEAMGENWDERTAGGEASVSGDVLRPMADLDKSWSRVNFREPNPLADAVLRAKRANKWEKSYAIPLLEDRDHNDNIHPMISTLQARTARMAVSRPPLQQLPSSDGKIRRAFIAPEEWAMFGVDYAQIEMRGLAAMADVRELKNAIMSGESIHKYTAALLFGPDYPTWKYKVAKNTGFCKVYGGGIRKVAQTSGVSYNAAEEVVKAYDNAFPEIKAFGRKLQRKAEYGKKEVITPSGRRLPLDRDRLYAATNYVVQSWARDTLADAIIRLGAADLDQYLLLPIHDELIGQAPAADAPEIMEEIRRTMETSFMGVPISAEGELFGRSWGGGYGMAYDRIAA